MTIHLKLVLLTTVVLALVAVVAIAHERQSEPTRSTQDGVYTQEQAQRGEKILRDACIRCHQPDHFKGSFLESWAGNTVGALYESIANTMPEDRPSSLKPQQYADILAYMFELNELPPGKEELEGDQQALGRIVIERRQK